jgi:hypothetical protein
MDKDWYFSISNKGDTNEYREGVVKEKMNRQGIRNSTRRVKDELRMIRTDLRIDHSI